MQLRSASPAWVKRVIWNFKHGHKEIGPAPSDILSILDDRLARKASVLDMGCGRGNLLRALRSRQWMGDYTGVDISSNAIDVGRSLGDQGAEWIVASLEQFTPMKTYDCILLLESIYYVRRDYVSSIIGRLRRSLSPNGVGYVRICDKVVHSVYLSLLLDLGQRVEWDAGPVVITSFTHAW